MSNDEELVRLCIKKNRAAQKELFEKYASKMMGICLRYTANQEDAKDILQEGFVKVFTELERFELRSSLYTWMARIFRNLAINKVTRGAAKYEHVELTENQFETSEEEHTDAWGGLTPNEVLKYVQQLPDHYRVVINMYAIDGCTHEEIAETLNISVGSSKSRLSRARALLRKEFNR